MRRGCWQITGTHADHRGPGRQGQVDSHARQPPTVQRVLVRAVPAGQVMLNALQVLPRDAELLAFEAGRDDYCEREVDEVEWQGGRVYLHLGACRDEPPRG